MHFQICLLLSEMQVIRDLLRVKDVVEESLNRLLLLLILKNSKFHMKIPVLESLFNTVAGMRPQLSQKETPTQVFFQ